MGRIRSIKPELPQSESMGRVSREARLLFILLFTIVDDAGRTRAASRMLASLLYPYDEDASTHIVAWLAELDREQCIERYEVEGTLYLQICKWSKHQKIDHPGKSRLPSPRDSLAKPREPSRALAKVSEGLAPDLGSRIIGSRTKDLGSKACAPASWVAAIHAELIQVGNCQHGQVGKMLQALYATHGDLLVTAAGAYRRAKLSDGVTGAKFARGNVVFDFAQRAGVYVDHVRPGGAADLLLEAER